jgi:hypothetical protein
VNWLNNIVACYPHVGTVETQKPQNTRNNRSTSVYCSLLGNTSLIAM